MAKLSGSILQIFIFTYLILNINGDCMLRFAKNIPIIQRHFGRKTILQNDFGGADRIDLSKDEIVTAFCETNLMWVFDGYNGGKMETHVKNITFQCIETDLKILNSNTDLNELRRDGRLGCSTNTLQLYESNKTLPNCNNYMSYGIGTKLLSQANFATIGLCYDLDTFSIKYAKFTANKPKFQFKDELQTTEESVVDLDIELKNFKNLFSNSFMSGDEFNNLYHQKKGANSLLTSIKFVYDDLIQNNLISKQFENFEELFKIVWWRDLQQRNWLNFQNIFKERNRNVTYLVHAGVSGTLWMPSLQSDEVFQLRENDKFVKAPLYIWNYLKSLDSGIEEEFVIIGHNTPFYKAGDADALCEDICDEINWLKNSLFGKLHLMPFYGVVNCCRAEDVAKKLENFPYENIKYTSTERSIETLNFTGLE